MGVSFKAFEPAVQKLSPTIFYSKKVSLTKLVMEYLIILPGQGFGCIIYSKDGLIWYKKCDFSVSSIFYELRLLELHSSSILKEDDSWKGARSLAFYYFIYSLFVHRLQNVTSLPYFRLFQTSTCMEIHTLQSNNFLTFFNRKLPSSYANYPNQVDKCKCEQQGINLWNSFVFSLYSPPSLLVCGPMELPVVFVLFPLFSVSCYLSFLCCFIFVTVSQPDNNVYKSIKETNSCKGISWLITSKREVVSFYKNLYFYWQHNSL